MKTLLKTTAVALLVGFAAPAFAQATPTTATANGSGTVKIIVPLTIAADTSSPLNFGTISASRAGTVTVSPEDGSRGGTLPNVGASATSQQKFNIAGDSGRTFTASVGSLTFTGTDAPTVVLTDNGVRQLTGTSAVLGVGGTLTVGANTPAAVYTGSFSVTVAYN